MALKPEVKEHYGELKLLINGEWVKAKSNEYSLDTNPATGKGIALTPCATAQEVNDACAAAQKAFLSWRNVAYRTRAQMAWDMREVFTRRFDELTRVLTQDHGRTLDESNGSVRRCMENMESAGALMYTEMLGRHVDNLAGGLDQHMNWEPKGVFLIIAPGNIPMHSLSSFLPYCLACGCTAVVSPSPQNPVASEYYIKATLEAGFPPGTVNMLHGDRRINELILNHPAVKGVCFIGSSAVGLELFKKASLLGKTSSINGNGKNHVVIAEDWKDLDSACDWLLNGCFGMTGQRCLGTDQVVILGDDKRYDEIKNRFVAAAKTMKLGYGLDDTTTLGPLATQAGKDRVVNWIATGLKEGAAMVLDGRNPELDPPYNQGYFLGPTIMENVTPNMNISKMEAFGPTANLLRTKNLEEPIQWINSTLGGHSASIFTSDAKKARYFQRNVDVGNVGINVAIAQPYAIYPLGSRRDASYGMAKSRADSIRMFLDQKTIVARWV